MLDVIYLLITLGSFAVLALLVRLLGRRLDGDASERDAPASAASVEAQR